MATPVKPGARNDLLALKEARRHTRDATGSAERMLDELTRMREQSGRPDYSRMSNLIGMLTVQLSKAHGELGEMWDIRQQSRQADEDTTLALRVADLEAQLAGLLERINAEKMLA